MTQKPCIFNTTFSHFKQQFDEGQQQSPETKSSLKKFSLEIAKNSSLRKTMHMKRFKYQKLSYESKPISVNNCQQNLFAIEPRRSECLDTLMATDSTKSKMLPMNSSTWVSNSKKLQKKLLLNKKGSYLQEMAEQKKCEKKVYCEINDNVVHDLKDYFHSVKSYFMNHKKKIDRERRMKVSLLNQIKFSLEEEANLNIVRLKPNTQHNNRNSRKQTLSQEDERQGLPSMTEYQSTNHLQRQSKEHAKQYLKNTKTANAKRSHEKIFQRKVAKKEDFYFIFGQIKPTLNDDEVQKLKLLYYRDFLWKISFNRGFVYEPIQETCRYYVGKGNNSRLIRKIMGKRPWWLEESKQQNANFIWTQLKVYDVYKNQRSLKEMIKIQSLPFCRSEVICTNKSVQQINPQSIYQNKLVQVRIQNPQDKNRYILNEVQYMKWRAYIKRRGNIEKKAYQDMHQRNIHILQKRRIVHKITNHLQFSRVIGNKKALYRTMEAYFNAKAITQWFIPLTYHITGGLENQQYLSFLREYYKRNKQGFSWWIVKPGELSNRGRDIKFCGNLQQIKDQLKQKKMNLNGSPRTYIVQSYIDKPFLYQGRKFDLRHYLMITSTQGKIRGYFYQEGYVRTTSYPYSLQNYMSGVHLTNDAVQKYLPQYGKFEKANKLSYNQLNEYMLKQNPEKSFFNTIFPQIKNISSTIIRAAFPFIDPERRANNLQIFGIDIMIDQNYKCWLIEVNTNPCIEVNCPVLAAVIPSMLDNAFTIGLDSVIVPPVGKAKVVHANYMLQNKFELVFDEQTDGEQILLNYMSNNIDIGNYGDDDDNYQSCEQGDFDA